MTRYDAPTHWQSRYDHFIGGEYVAPHGGRYFENPTPVTGQTFCEVARGTAEDVEKALDAAHGAADAWGRTPMAERGAAAQPDRRPDAGVRHRPGEPQDDAGALPADQEPAGQLLHQEAWLLLMAGAPASQWELWRHTMLTVDVVPGRGSGFSLEAPEGVRFLIRSDLAT